MSCYALDVRCTGRSPGVVDQIFVLQGSLRVTQDPLAATPGRVLTNMIAVYRPLVGEWQIRSRQRSRNVYTAGKNHQQSREGPGNQRRRDPAKLRTLPARRPIILQW